MNVAERAEDRQASDLRTFRAPVAPPVHAGAPGASAEDRQASDLRTFRTEPGPGPAVP